MISFRTCGVLFCFKWVFAMYSPKPITTPPRVCVANRLPTPMFLPSGDFFTSTVKDNLQGSLGRWADPPAVRVELWCYATRRLIY